MEFVCDIVSDKGSPETLIDVPYLQMLPCSPSVVKISDEKAGRVDQKLDLKYVVEGGSNASARNSLSGGTKSKMGKSVALSLQDIKKATHGLNLVSIESGLMNQLGQVATSGIVHGRPYFVSSTSMKTASSTHIAKPRTWH
ncbi:hypothetical protein ACFX1S_043992 [Malus domestica]